MIKYLCIDLDLPQTRPSSRLSSIFSIRNGIFSPLQRLRLQNPDVPIYFFHPNADYERQIAQIESILPFRDLDIDAPDCTNWRGNPKKIRQDMTQLENEFDKIVLSSRLNPVRLLENLGKQIKRDVKLWSKSASLVRSSVVGRGREVIGKIGQLYLHKEAILLPGIVLDTREGPIVIDRGVEVGPFSYLKGPLYVAPGAQLDNVRITGSIVGEGAKLAGEIENSIIGRFTNKHHDGFCGHSIVGNWVNIGALSTNSDLKNNYGNVRIEVPQEFPTNSQRISIDTKAIKFGMILGDYVKLAIGVFISNGTIIDACANILKNPTQKYIPPFSWGEDSVRYELDRFFQDTQKIMARRNQEFSQNLRELVANLYNQ